jgi:integrase
VEQEMNALDEQGTVHLVATAAETRLYLPVLLAVTTGLRLGEILGLRWCDVDMDAGTLTVRQALEETRAAGLNFKPPKTHRSKRPVALPSLIVDALRLHKGAQAQQRLLLGPAWKDYGLVCPRDTGEPWSPRIVSKAFEHLAEKAGVPQIRFHDLRHSHASQLLKQGIHFTVVSKRLGHKRPATTLDIYSHLLPGMQEEAAERTDSALRAAMNTRKAA